MCAITDKIFFWKGDNLKEKLISTISRDYVIKWLQTIVGNIIYGVFLSQNNHKVIGWNSKFEKTISMEMNSFKIFEIINLISVENFNHTRFKILFFHNDFLIVQRENKNSAIRLSNEHLIDSEEENIRIFNLNNFECIHSIPFKYIHPKDKFKNLLLCSETNSFLSYEDCVIRVYDMIETKNKSWLLS